MSNTQKKKNRKPSIFEEVLSAVVALFLGDITSKLGYAALTMLFGIIVLVSPMLDQSGNKMEKTFIPYVIGSVLIAISISLISSWLRNRKTGKNDSY